MDDKTPVFHIEDWMGDEWTDEGSGSEYGSDNVNRPGCSVCNTPIDRGVYSVNVTKRLSNGHTISTDLTYCAGCCPEWVELFILEEEAKYNKQQELVAKLVLDRDDRRTRLTAALVAAGLELRSDSAYCEKFIYQGEGEIPQIVTRMAQMKYLFEYCDIGKKMDEIYIGGSFEPSGRYSLLREAEKQILEKIGGYPEQFPWAVAPEKKNITLITPVVDKIPAECIKDESLAARCTRRED